MKQAIIDKIKEALALLEALQCGDETSDSDSLIPLPDRFVMRTDQISKDLISHKPFNTRIGNNRWMSETFNSAYFSVNAWGFGGNAGGTQELKDAYIELFETPAGKLAFEWWVGGYWDDFNGNPGDGWWTPLKGGNDVKGYPRLGIGSASGQEVSTTGAPFNVPCIDTEGWKHVDQEAIRSRVGLPETLQFLPNIDINVRFEMKSDFKDGNDKYGNYFFAIDSYLHDISNNKVARESLEDDIDGINDTSGSIYNQPMSDLPLSSKEWAIMIWFARTPYYESSGGRQIGEAFIDGHNYLIKYKIETASDKDFKYLAFVRDVDPDKINQQSGTINYNAFAEFYTSGAMQDMLGPDIKAPTSSLVLSDINMGIEVLSNPDIQFNSTKYPVTCEFSEISFEVEGKGKFGFKA